MEPKKKIVLCIDDEPMFTRTVSDFLEDTGYMPLSALNGREGLKLYQEESPDIVLIDLNMPDINGLEILSSIREDSDEVPVIIISGTGEIKDVIKALRLGAWDYLTKPIENMAMLEYAVNRVLNHSQMLRENREYRENLEELVQQRTEELEKSNDHLFHTLKETVNSLAAVTEKRDPYTAGHQERVSILASAIARSLGLDQHTINAIRIAGMLHDVGKISVPQELLSKPTRLTDYEFEIVKTHSTSGFEIIKNIPFDAPVAEMVHQHHERLDGSGYPRGLAGDEILQGSRILVVADVVEAMSSHRPYRPAVGIDHALEEIQSQRGILYDEECVNCCVDLFNGNQDDIESLRYYYVKT